MMPEKTPHNIEQEVLRLHRAGRSKREIQNATGIGWGTVWDIIKRNDPDLYETDKTKTHEATQARLARIRNQKLKLAEDLTNDTERMRERVWGTYTVPMMGQEGVEQVVLAEPPLREQADGMRAIEAMVRTVDTIIDRETVDEAAEAKDVLATIFDGLGRMFEDNPPPLRDGDLDHDYDVNDNRQ